MRNPPGKHLLRVASRTVGSSALGGGGAISATAPVAAASSTSSSGGRSLWRSGGRPLRATSPPPPSAVSWESRTMRCDGEDDWEVVDTGDEEAVEAETTADAGEETVDGYRLVFGSPPTGDEVRAAVASIQEIFENHPGLDSDALEKQTASLSIAGHSSSGIFENPLAVDLDATEKQIVPLSNSGHFSSDNSIGSDDWIEPAAHVLNSTALLTREHRTVLDAFHLLQIDPSIQKMVMALSSDKAVWNAVMNNEAVQEFRKSFHDAKETNLEGDSTGPAEVLKWVLGNTQDKIMEFLEKIIKVVNMLFHPQGNDDNSDLYDDAVRMSFMLSVFVFIVVTMARIK